jgi:RNA-dependent RNA polymerase
MPTDTFVRDSQRSPLYQHIIAPPTSRHREGPCSIPPLREPVAKSRHDKPRKGWNELTIKIKNIAPVDLKTLKIWEVFSREGNVCFIEIFEVRNGRRDGNARVRFSPAPMNPVWQNRRGRYAFPGTDCNYFVDIELVNNGKRGDQVQSLLKKGTYYDPVLQFNVRKIHFGIMVDKSSMMPLYAAQPIHSDISKSPILEVDLRRHRITASFDVGFYQQGGECNRINRYMLQIPFASLQKIQRMDIDGSQTFTLIISLASPPQFFLKRQDNQAGHSEEGLTWSDFDTWYRQTDIVYNPLDLVTKRVALHKNAPIIDIGKFRGEFETVRSSSNNFSRTLDDIFLRVQ